MRIKQIYFIALIVFSSIVSSHLLQGQETFGFYDYQKVLFAHPESSDAKNFLNAREKYWNDTMRALQTEFEGIYQEAFRDGGWTEEDKIEFTEKVTSCQLRIEYLQIKAEEDLAVLKDSINGCIQEDIYMFLQGYMKENNLSSLIDISQGLVLYGTKELDHTERIILFIQMNFKR